MKLEDPVETELPMEEEERDTEFYLLRPEDTGKRSVFQHSDHRRGLFSGLGSAVCEASVLSETQGILWK